MWYLSIDKILIPSVKIDPTEDFLRSGKYPVLTVLSAGHALHVFVNGQLAGRHYIVGSMLFGNPLY